MPTLVNLGRDQQHRFDGPQRTLEVQQGKVQLQSPNGKTSRPTGAGKTIPGGDVGGTILRALEPSIVRVTASSEAEVAERTGQRAAERQAAKAAQGEDAAPEPARPPSKPPVP